MTPHRILLVDDTPLDVELTCLALGELGLRRAVHVASCGQEALDYLKGADLPELLLLDLKMPGVDGLAVLRAVRDHPQWRALRVVMLTTSGEARDRDACLQAGADAFVQKSARLGDFVQAMREVVRA